MTAKNFPELKPVMDVTGAWEVTFDPKWFYPDNGTGGKVTFNELTDWTDRSELGIKYYSGIATYRKTFVWPSSDLRPPTSVVLSLGTVKNVARVRLNGRDLGTVWTAPWQVDISSAVKPGANVLEIEVANLWPNRLIGDATLPKEERRTVTNVRTYDTQKTASYGCKKCGARKKDAEAQKAGKSVPLLPSGLIGPVRLMQEE